MHVAFAQSTAIDYELLVSSMPGLYLILAPDLTIVNVSEAYLHNTLLNRDDLVGRKFFEALPENPALAESSPLNTLKKSLLHVLNFHTTHSIPVLRYDITKPKNLGGGFDERYWMITNHPVVDKNDKLQYIVHQVIDVTMQQMAHRQINTNRERYDLLAQASSDVIWDWDLLNNHIWWSEGFQEIFGYNQHDFSNIEAWVQKVHPEEQENLIKSIYETVNIGGKTWTDSYRFQRADGSYAHVMERGYILHDDNGVAYRMVGAMFDITDQIEKSQKSRPSHDNYQKILDAMPNLAWCIKPGTNARNGASYSNRAWKEYTGLSTDLLHGADKVMHSDDLVTAPAKLARCLETQHRFEQEIRLKNRKTGNYRWFNSRAVPILDEKGNVSLWFGTCTDINDQKELKTASRTSQDQPEPATLEAPVTETVTKETVQVKESKPAETQNSDLLAQLPLPAWTIPANGAKLQGNSFFAEIIGASEITLENWLNLIHPEDLEQYQLHLNQAQESGVFAEITYRLKNLEGNYNRISEKAKPTYKEGAISFWLHTCTNVDAFKAVEVVAETPALAPQPVHAGVTFHVQNLAQDLKKPLANLQTIFEELTKTAAFSDPDTEQLTQFFRKSVAQTQQLVNNIESVAKAEQATEETPLSLIPLEPVFDNVKIQLQEKLWQADLNIAPNFSAAPGAWFSAEKLHNLLTTLLTAVLKTTAASEPKQITLTSSLAGIFTLITARSNQPLAINLNAELTPDFNFYLLQREIARRGGRIEFGSTGSDNTLFRIYLRKPLSSILLIDEDETTNFLNKRLLGRLVNGIEITTKTAASEALNYLQETGNNPDLIFLDLKTAVLGNSAFLEKYNQLKLDQPLPEIILLAPCAGYNEQALQEQYPFIRQIGTSPLTEEITTNLLQEFLAV